ncbi:MAG: ATP-binding protein [Treponema sp.]|nr:ATP-binding protein [Treponema sp.]
MVLLVILAFLLIIALLLLLGLYRAKTKASRSLVLSLKAELEGMVAELSRRAEQAEAESRRINAILNGMSEAVLAVDSKLILYLANPRAQSLFGPGSAEKISLLAATRSTELENIARRVLAEGRSLEVELSLWAGFAHTRTEQRFQAFAAPIPAGVVIVMEDITRLAKLEQVRKDFIANVSHELRTPIQLIKGYSETMLDSPDTMGPYRRCMEVIYKNALTMENLTNDLLVLSNLENAGNDRLDLSGMMEEQALAPLITEAALSVEPQAKKKNITVHISCPADLKATVHGSFIIQALINLLENGVKYSPKKTALWVSAYSEHDHVVLAVKDEGMGIPPEHLERIFERFYRVDRAHNRETGGTGLGLSIVRHIALIHNGTTEVESHAGEGSVFRIKIAR